MSFSRAVGPGDSKRGMPAPRMIGITPREYSEIRFAARNDEANRVPPINQARVIPRSDNSPTTSSIESEVTVMDELGAGRSRFEKTQHGLPMLEKRSTPILSVG